MTQWDHLLTQTITVSEQSGVDSRAMPSYGAQSTMPARVEQANEIRLNQQGNEQLATHVIVTSTEIGLNARVWFPGENTADNDVAHRPISVKKASQPVGDTLYETYF